MFMSALIFAVSARIIVMVGERVVSECTCQSLTVDRMHSRPHLIELEARVSKKIAEL
jgi:hypothetical protein